MQLEDIELGVLAHAESGHAAVVMIHDVWGLSGHTRDLAARLAADGIHVLALDLYRREVEVKIENPGAWMRGLSDPQALGDVQAAVDRLTASGHRVGVVGFCMGGMYALMAAARCSGLAAAVPFYGLLSHGHGILFDEQGLDPALKPSEPLALASEVECPTLAFFGDQDEFVPMDDIRALEAAFETASASAEVVVYPGAGHAFMNDTREEAFRPETAADAWGRMLVFLRAHLGAG